MIDLTKLNGSILMINPDYIQFVEETPDTVITFRDGSKIIVKEDRNTIRKLTIDYKKQCN